MKKRTPRGRPVTVAADAKTITARLTEDAYKALYMICQNEQCGTSEAVRKALMYYIKKRRAA